MDDAIDEALDFIESATPFEISQALAEIGVTTSHRDGIEKILSAAWPDPQVIRLQSPVDLHELIKPVMERWKAEIEAKHHELDFEDLVFLAQVANRSALSWLLRINELPMLQAALGLTTPLKSVGDKSSTG